MASATIEARLFTRDSEPSLAYTLYHPATPTHKVALVSHPLGRLGGSQRDHVVVSLARILQGEGWTVCTYDARGAGESEGSASFSALPEAQDYSAILTSVVLPQLSPAPATPSPRPEILLAGYSFGSLAASHCPSPALPETFTQPRVRRLLVSYPLSVRWALTALRQGEFVSALESLTETGETMEVHGDQDQFTAVGKYRSWSEDLRRRANGRWKTVEVQGDHFWREKQSKSRLLQSVKEWLSEEEGNAIAEGG